MTTKEKATGILRHYLKLKYDVDQFEVDTIYDHEVGINFTFKDMLFTNDEMRIIFIDFYKKRIYAAIDIEDAREYVKTNINEVELFE